VINEGNWCIGIFLDLKKAFDTVQHDILLRKLSKYGINGIALDWFKSYLSDRSQCVDINGNMSEFKCILMSVLQGSSLGPILFLVFINDIFYCTNLNMCLFADDTNALAKGDNLMDLMDHVNLELNKIALWFKANKLVVNSSKTKYMIFRAKNRNINLNGKEIYMDFNEPNGIFRPELRINLTRVHNDADKNNQTYKLLGVAFDEYLSFNQQITQMQRKISRSLYLLNRSKNFLTKNALRMLYFATVHSHLMYCPIITSICSKTNMNKLFVLQKKAVHIITGSKVNDHTPPLFIEQAIMPLDMIIKQAKLKFMHSVKFNYCPKSFINVFVENRAEDHNYDLRNMQDFLVPRARIKHFKRIPIYTLPDKWNNCGDLQFYSNVTTFKITLYETLFREYAIFHNLTGE
jgi:hypothetical protein